MAGHKRINGCIKMFKISNYSLPLLLHIQISQRELESNEHILQTSTITITLTTTELTS